MKGSIEKRGENSWRLIVSDGSDAAGRRIRFTKTLKGSNESQAETLLARFLTEIKDGKKAKSGTMKLSDLFDFWIKNHGEPNCEETTIYYNRIVFSRVLKHLGGIRIDKITPRHLLDLYKEFQQPGEKKLKTKKDGSIQKPPQALSPATIKKMHGLLHAIFEKAVRWDLLSSNPAARVDPPRVPHKEKTIYNKQQIEAFLQALEAENPKHRLWVLLALTSTLRREEIFGLEWKNWPDVPGNVIVIQTCSVVAGKVVTKGTKNKSSNRIVSIPRTVASLLKEHRKNEFERKDLLGEKWQGSNRMFTTFEGANAHPVSFNTWLNRFAEVNGLPHVSPHALRHIAGSILTHSNIDVRTVAKKMGHSKVSTLLDIYAHTLTAVEHETAVVMQNVLDSAAVKMEKAPLRIERG